MATVSTWLKTATNTLKVSQIDTPRLDTLVLLEDEIKKDRSWILSHPEHVLQIKSVDKLNTKIGQRCLHMPLAYIRSRSEFYGRDFIVNNSVLVPRPESETIIELLKSLIKLGDVSQPTIADVGTGSGALAITAKLEIPKATVIGIDIDPNCLITAKQNGLRYNTDVTWLQGDLLEPARNTSIDILLCNLPYVPIDFSINRAAAYEPSLALFGGKDGLNLYRSLFMQIRSFSHQPHYILTESLPFQHSELATIAKAAGYLLLEVTDDFIQCFSYN